MHRTVTLLLCAKIPVLLPTLARHENRLSAPNHSSEAATGHRIVFPSLYQGSAGDQVACRHAVPASHLVLGDVGRVADAKDVAIADADGRIENAEGSAVGVENVVGALAGAGPIAKGAEDASSAERDAAAAAGEGEDGDNTAPSGNLRMAAEETPTSLETEEAGTERL